MLKKIVSYADIISIFCSLVFSMLPAYAMEEDFSSESSSASPPIKISSYQECDSNAPAQYLVVLQKAYQGDPNSIDGLYDCLVELQKLCPQYYKKKLRKFYEKTLDSDVSSANFATQITAFIENRRNYRLRPSPLICLHGNF